MGKLDGKVAIVTGAARGLGRAYAKRLAGLGAKVAVADLNLRSYGGVRSRGARHDCQQHGREIEASGGAAIGIEVDVRDHEAVGGMVARVVQEWGRVDVLVANAGGGRGRPMDTKASTLDPALLQLVTEMNLFGTVYRVAKTPPAPSHRPAGGEAAVPTSSTLSDAAAGRCSTGAINRKLLFQYSLRVDPSKRHHPVPLQLGASDIRSLNRALVTASTRGCRPGRGRSRNPSMPSSSYRLCHS